MATVADGPFALSQRAVRIHRYGDARGLVSMAACLVVAGVVLVALGGGRPVSTLGLFLWVVGGTAAVCGVASFVCAGPIWLGAALGALRRRAVVRVSDALVVESCGEREVFPLASIRRARLSRAADAIALRTDDRVEIELPLETIDEADQLVEAIAAGQPAGVWSARVDLGAPAWTRKVVAVGGGFLVMIACASFAAGVVAFALGVLAGVSIGVLAAVAGWPRLAAELVLGRDGVAIARGGRDRFVPLSRIARVEATRAGVALTLSDGERLRLGLAAPRPWGAAGRADYAPALAEHRRGRLIALLRGRLGPRDPVAAAATLLERRGRALPDWQSALRDLVCEGRGYRAAALAREQALEVLEDGGAPLELRIGAALALSPAPPGAAPAGAPPAGEDVAGRLRLAIDACASRDVRAALEQAAEGELEETTLERALRCTG